ncbi:MAG TPA: hypothetical protein PLA71_00805 [Saccharofermentans sp.]|nr:hypothetical protein [Saccharofermentans sp.]
MNTFTTVTTVEQQKQIIDSFLSDLKELLKKHAELNVFDDEPGIVAFFNVDGKAIAGINLGAHLTK